VWHRGSRRAQSGIGLVTSNGSGALIPDLRRELLPGSQLPDRRGGDLQLATNGALRLHDCRIQPGSLPGEIKSIFLSSRIAMSCSALANRKRRVSLTNSALKGMYAGFATHRRTSEVTVFPGNLRPTRHTTGNLTGTEDIGAPSDRLPERRSKRPIP